MATYVTRTLKDGSKRIKVVVRRKNAPTAAKTFRERREAVAWATLLEGEILSGYSSPRIEATRHTVADAIKQYKEVELSRKTRKPKAQIAQLDWWSTELGHLKLAQLTGPLICRCRDKLASGTTVQGKPRQPATVNRYLAALSHVLSVATRDWGWMPESPMSRVRKLKEPRGRVRYLSSEELNALVAAGARSSDPYLYVILILAISTGMRRGEITTLRVGDIDWERKRIILQQTKNGERRAVPLASRPGKLLREIIPTDAHRNDPAFPSTTPGYEDRPWDFQRAWKGVLKEAQLDDFRFHDLRHSCASYLAMTGATTTEIAEVLGHKTLQMVKRYAHLTESHISKLLEKMNDRFLPDNPAMKAEVHNDCKG